MSEPVEKVIGKARQVGLSIHFLEHTTRGLDVQAAILVIQNIVDFHEHFGSLRTLDLERIMRRQ